MFIIVAGLLSAPNLFEKRTPIIPSLSNNWDLLETSARKWQSDAYLTSVTIDLGKKDVYKFSAEFHSKNLPNSMFFVGITYLGEVNTMPYDFPPSQGSAASEPIFRKDWVIDSQEALKIFAKDEIAASCLESFNGLIELELTSSSTFRMFFGENHTTAPIWRLTFWGCPEDGKTTDYYLNAKTGEIVNRDTK